MMNRPSLIAFTVAGLLSVSTFALGQTGQDLADAAEAGDMAAVRSLLDSGADVNAAQRNGSTALHWAIYRDDAETVDLLIDRGADVTVKTREGISPLFMASLYGNAVIIESLLDDGRRCE